MGNCCDIVLNGLLFDVKERYERKTGRYRWMEIERGEKEKRETEGGREEERERDKN